MPVIRAGWFQEIPTDEFNHNRNRNIKNTDKKTYNCGGFALNTFSWYIPCYETGFWTEAEAQLRTYYCINTMLAEFSDLRLIGDVRELHADEYAVVFRISSDGDFHYLKRGRNGKWYSKLGSLTKITVHNDDYVFNEYWCDGRYDGPVVLFAKKL